MRSCFPTSTRCWWRSHDRHQTRGRWQAGPGQDPDQSAPLANTLPALFQEDDFTQRFISAFDAALAPVFATLDNLPAYLDPWLAPEDFLEWLASWFGMALDESWSLERRRGLGAKDFVFSRVRGAAAGPPGPRGLLTRVAN